MKKLYMIAGGTDGYASIVYSFDEEAIDTLYNKCEESYAATDSKTSITVPDECTYESLGIHRYDTAEGHLADIEEEELLYGSDDEEDDY